MLSQWAQEGLLQARLGLLESVEGPAALVVCFWRKVAEEEVHGMLTTLQAEAVEVEAARVAAHVQAGR